MGAARPRRPRAARRAWRPRRPPSRAPRAARFGAPRVRSANTPGRCSPSSARRSHRFSSPRRQAGQRPAHHERVDAVAARAAPRRSRPPRGPARAVARRGPACPLKGWRSEPQMPGEAYVEHHLVRGGLRLGRGPREPARGRRARRAPSRDRNLTPAHEGCEHNASRHADCRSAIRNELEEEEERCPDCAPGPCARREPCAWRLAACGDDDDDGGGSERPRRRSPPRPSRARSSCGSAATSPAPRPARPTASGSTTRSTASRPTTRART